MRFVYLGPNFSCRENLNPESWFLCRAAITRQGRCDLTNSVAKSLIADDLSTTRFRFLNDVQIGAFRRKYGATRDEVRAAAIMADRIRRHRQAEEQRNTFRVDLVPIEAPIVLPREVKLPTRKWDR